MIPMKSKSRFFSLADSNVLAGKDSRAGKDLQDE